MIDLTITLLIILSHWISDFVLQSREIANKKGTDIQYLNLHSFIYALSTSILWLIIFNIFNIDFKYSSMCIVFCLVHISHFCTDFISSRITHRAADDKNWYVFFTTIGFDNTLHYFQLLLIYYFVIN